MEWQAPAVVLGVSPYGEGDALACVLTADYGAWRGLARGGASRAKSSTWQAGNVIDARWIARLEESLGSFTAELSQAIAASAMQDPWRLGVLSAAVSLTAAALPEREPHPRVLAAHLTLNQGAIAELVRFEMVLLADLGFGLDLSACAVNGQANDLSFVSPRSGRAVSNEAAGKFRDRLLPLPLFLIDPEHTPTPAELAEGMRLTSHFLSRDLFGAQHKPLPASRIALAESLAVSSAGEEGEGRHAQRASHEGP